MSADLGGAGLPDTAGAPAFRCEPIPGEPDWFSWDLHDDTRFNAVIAPLRFRREGPATVRVRLLPGARHANLNGVIHGGVTLSLIDIGIFAAAQAVNDADISGSVTLDLTNQFIGAGRLDSPLDAVIDVVRETGRLIFLRGLAVQQDHVVASFTATLRKPSRR